MIVSHDTMLALPTRLAAQDENSGDVVDVVQGIAIGDDGSVYCGGFSGAEIAGVCLFSLQIIYFSI